MKHLLTRIKGNVNEYFPSSRRGFYHSKNERGRKTIKELLNTYRWFITSQEEKMLTLEDILSLDKAWIPFERNDQGI